LYWSPLLARRVTQAREVVFIGLSKHKGHEDH